MTVTAPKWPTVQMLSIVIPALNERNNIASTASESASSVTWPRCRKFSGSGWRRGHVVFEIYLVPNGGADVH